MICGMSNKTYSEKLKDPRWQRLRLEILQRDDWQCFYCGDKKTTLHVHHVMYIGKDPWDTPPDCLMTLCEDCHSVEHLEFTELEKSLLDTLRMRDRLNFDMIRLINKHTKRLKGIPVD
jgi:hypothetical protein